MILLPVSLAGALLFAWPLLGLPAPTALPAILAVAAAILAVGSVEVAGRRLDSRHLALLCAIAAIDSGLRLALVVGIGGFSPVFFLILCAGFALGPSFGFLAGTTTMLASALATGGVGIWLPYEMLGVGWCGLAAGVAGGAFRRRGGVPLSRDLVILAAVGAITGLAYGAAMDIWDWSLLRDVPDIGFTPGLGPSVALHHFVTFYLTTSSFVWDLFRAVGNVLAIALLGRPVLSALERLQRRFSVTIEELDTAPVTASAA